MRYKENQKSNIKSIKKYIKSIDKDKTLLYNKEEKWKKEKH